MHPFSCSFNTFFLLILFAIEEITGCTNDTAKGANKAPRNPPSLFLFNVLVFQWDQILEHLNTLVIL